MAYYLTVDNWNQTLPETKGSRAWLTSKMAPQCRNWEVGDLLTADLFNCIVNVKECKNGKPIWKVTDAQWVRYETTTDGRRREVVLEKKEKNAIKIIEIEVL